MVRGFEDKLALDRSPAMVRKVRVSLSAILADAQERGLVGQNVARGLRARRQRGKEARADKRQKGKLKVGVDFPAPDEIRAILAPSRPLEAAHHDGDLYRASGFRAARLALGRRRSEARRVARASKGRLLQRHRSPEVGSGERVVPLPPTLITRCASTVSHAPRGGLISSSRTASATSRFTQHIVQRGLQPAQIAAGVVTKTGKAKYPGLHALQAFLRQLVHQSPRRRRARTAA